MIQYSLGERIMTVNNVSLSYDTTPVLRDINIEVDDILVPGKVTGQIRSIVGLSGCGKTSLFNMMAGYIIPTTGQILVDQDQHRVKKGDMGVVPQDYPLLNHRTVRRNFELALQSVKGKEKTDMINEYTEYFGLTPQLNHFPCDLSGGQRQRAAILQQVFAGNKIILMDEPFSGLDTRMKDKVIELLLKIAALNEYNTLIIISHDIASCCAISDHVHVIGGNTGEGSTIIKTYDFLAEDLAYHPEIQRMPKFMDIIEEIKRIM